MDAGDGLRMPVDWLDPTPFDSWLWPGIFLLAVIAVPMTAAAVLEIVRSPKAFAASMLAAAAQFGWIKRRPHGGGRGLTVAGAVAQRRAPSVDPTRLGLGRSAPMR
jgi:hypothetical protein